MIHELKIEPIWYEDVSIGVKNFEIRFCKDRNFEVGDILILREWCNSNYTDKPPIIRIIEYIYNGNGNYGLLNDYCIIGMKKI